MRTTVIAFLAGSSALALAGCSSLPGFSDKENSPAASVLAFGTTTPPPIPAIAANPQLDLDCPHVEVLEGTSALRVGAREGSSGVRYQYSLGDVARECTVVGNQISIKVGVQGRVLIGPAGAPGTFSVPVRVAVRSEKDQKIIASKLYRASATIPSSDTQTDFTVVSEPLLVPYTRPRADEDYTVLVGFDQSGGRGDAPVKKRRRQ